MVRRVSRRMAFYALAAWASITLNFLLPRMMPGDPAAAMFARFRGSMRPEAIQALKETFGFTGRPLPAEYVTYLLHVIRGDLGISVAYFPAPVSHVIARGLLWTLVMTGVAVVVSFALGSLLGVLAAWRRGGVADSVVLPSLVFLGAFPYFWLAMLALYGLAFVLGWFPLGHAYDDDLVPALSFDFLGSVVAHAVLPALTIVAATVGGWMLSMRSTMTSVLSEDYVTMARAKGLSDRWIMLRYAAHNALLPNVAGFGMALGFVLSGSLLTEVVFSYPGEGYLLVEAVHSQDYPLIQGIFLFITLAMLAANALVDVVSTWLDPRTRTP
jgi:peptide/nickel transport system permease protein